MPVFDEVEVLELAHARILLPAHEVLVNSGAWQHEAVTDPQVRWALARLDDAGRAAALAVLSPAELSRYDERPTDAFLAGRLLLRSLAGDLLRMPPAAVPLVAVCPDCGGNHGRPVIVGAPLHVSLTHTPDHVIAVASPARVGIDSSSDAGWARVEAVLKADGRGLRVDPGHVVLERDAAGVTVGRVADAASVYCVYDVEPVPGVRATVAVVDHAVERGPRTMR